MVVILVDDTPALLTIQCGHLNLRVGRESFEDVSMPGRPITANIEENDVDGWQAFY